jgi:hypothetical protein
MSYLRLQQHKSLPPSLSLSSSHDPQLPKSLQHLLIHTTQPLLLEPLLTPDLLDNSLEVFADKDDEVDLVDGVGVDEFALADVFWGFRFGWVVGFWGPV